MWRLFLMSDWDNYEIGRNTDKIFFKIRLPLNFCLYQVMSLLVNSQKSRKNSNGLKGWLRIIYQCAQCTCVHSVLSWLFAAHQTPLSMGFSRQEYSSGLPWPPPGDLSTPGVELTSPASPVLAGGFFTTWATWEAAPMRCPYKQQ